MPNDKEQKLREARLAHVNGHLEVGFKDTTLIKTSGYIKDRANHSYSLCLHFNSFALAKAMISWFERHDLKELKNWGFFGGVATKAGDYIQGMTNSIDPSAMPFSKLLLPLISDNRKLVDWFAHEDFRFDSKRIEDRRKTDFWAYQSRLALRGEWGRLKKRSLESLAAPPRSGWVKKYGLDNRFYLALADGDIAGMETYLAELTTPAMMRRRSHGESGFTRDLISTHGVIFAKMAWLHGYRVKVDSPYVPQEWLPIAPLDHYDYPFPFARELDVDTREEFAAAWARKKPAPTVPDRV